MLAHLRFVMYINVDLSCCRDFKISIQNNDTRTLKKKRQNLSLFRYNFSLNSYMLVGFVPRRYSFFRLVSFSLEIELNSLIVCQMKSFYAQHDGLLVYFVQGGHVYICLVNVITHQSR